MGRRSHHRRLSIWSNGRRVGEWILAPGGQSQLRYDPDWVGSAYGCPLSLSLPFNLENRPLQGASVQFWFDNLLPDSDAIRRRIADRYATSTGSFDLLQAIGRDCVGAVQLLPEDQAPTGHDRIDAEPLDEQGVARIIQHALSPTPMHRYGADTDDLRISLAGAQEKTALLWWDGQWQLPRGATPTTHILKLPLGLIGGGQIDFRTSVDNEWLCLRLLRAYGVPVADADIATFGSHRVLVVRRFDRRQSSDRRWWMRLFQEDFCQASGCPPHLKYESDGGPGLRALFNVLQRSIQAEADRRTLLRSQILYWLLRAPDGHAKNFSLHLLAGGRYHLTPLYDVMSAWPVLGEGHGQISAHKVKLAMALWGRNRHYTMRDIRHRHFLRTAADVGCGDIVATLLDEIIARTPQAVAEVLSDLPRDLDGGVVHAVLTGVQAAATMLQD